REREANAHGEVEHVADRLCLTTVLGDRRAEQKREVHSCDPHFARRPRHGGQHQSPDESACECGPENRHTPTRGAALSAPYGAGPGPAVRRPSCVFTRVMAVAASMSARWTSACGKFPRKSPLTGSISSA